MNIYFATKNEGKVATAQTELSDFNIQFVHHPINFSEPRSYDLNKIASEKAMQALSYLHAPLIAVDAGFYIDRWPDFPGPFTNHVLETLGLEGIMKLVEQEEHGCEFRHVVAYIDSTFNKPKNFPSIERGKIHKEIGKPRPEGKGWSELNRIFVPDGWDKPVSELSENEYEEYKVNRPPIYKKFGEWVVNNKWNTDR